MKMTNYVVFDIEATCSKNPTDAPFMGEIIEIGAVKTNTEFQKGDVQGWLIQPKLVSRLPEYCKELTTLTDEEVFNKKNKGFRQTFNEFMEWAGDSYFLGWGEYDKVAMMKNIEMNNLEGEFFLSRYIDAQRLFEQQVMPRLNTKHNKKHRLSLERAIFYSGLEEKGTPHRGLHDAMNLKRVLEENSRFISLDEYLSRKNKGSQKDNKKKRKVYPKSRKSLAFS